MNAVAELAFSGGHMDSPVSRSTAGECNAIKSRGFGRSELTFASTLETEVCNRRYLSPLWRLTAHKPALLGIR